LMIYLHNGVYELMLHILTAFLLSWWQSYGSDKILSCVWWLDMEFELPIRFIAHLTTWSYK
jgi:hypothetical protein